MPGLVETEVQAKQEQRSELFTLSMTRREKTILAELARENGATMSGLLRKLIRDAGSRAKGKARA